MAQGPNERNGSPGRPVRLLTNAGSVLAEVVRQPEATMREIARRCGKTERAVWEVLQSLEDAGFLRRRRQGRRNRYDLDLAAIRRQVDAEAAALFAVAQHSNGHRATVGSARV
jgi:DNA-binding IclR family transcriptional regulator